MNFDLTEDQKMLVDTAASFAKKSSPVTRFRKLREDERGWEPSVWRQMGELGWLGVAFPESVGGFGGRFIDAALVLEQFGKTLVPEPYIPSVVLAGRALLAAGDSDQQGRWLKPLLEGKTSAALAYAERDARYDWSDVSTTAVREGDSYRLSGEKVWVLNGGHCDFMVVSARTAGDQRQADGVSLFVVEPSAAGLTIEPVPTMDGHRAAMVRLDGVVVGADQRLGEEGGASSVLEGIADGAAAAACAEGMGIAQRVLDMTVEYLKTREQFGAVIGTFQALQHRAVDMFVKVEVTKSVAIEAALRIDEGDEDQRRASVSAAKAQLSSGGRYVTSQGIQLHGGIGITDEHDIGLYFKRMRTLTTLFGDEAHHVDCFASSASTSA